MTIFRTKAPKQVRLERRQSWKSKLECFIKMNFHWIVLGMGIMLMVMLVLLAFLVVGPTESGLYYNHGGML